MNYKKLTDITILFVSFFLLFSDTLHYLEKGKLNYNTWSGLEGEKAVALIIWWAILFLYSCNSLLVSKKKRRREQNRSKIERF